MAMALRLGAGPAKAAPTRRSVRGIFPAAHVAGKNDSDSFRLAPETRKGNSLPGLFPEGRGTKVPGRLPTSVGSACCPARRLAALPAEAFGAVSLRLPCGKGAGARRATEGLLAGTSPNALAPPGRLFSPLLPRWVRELKFLPPNAFPPPFRGRLPGGGGEVSSTSHIQALPRRKIPPGLCHFFRRCRRSETSYGNYHYEGTGPGADPEHRQK